MADNNLNFIPVEENKKYSIGYSSWFDEISLFKAENLLSSNLDEYLASISILLFD